MLAHPRSSNTPRRLEVLATPHVDDDDTTRCATKRECHQNGVQSPLLSRGNAKRFDDDDVNDDAENTNSLGGVSSPMTTREQKKKLSTTSNNVLSYRDLPMSPLRERNTNSSPRAKERRASMRAHVNRWRSEKKTTNTPTRLRDVKSAKKPTKTTVVSTKEEPTTAEREVERVTEALNNVKDAELEMSRNETKKHAEFARALERQIEEKARKRVEEKEEALANAKLANAKAIETFTKRIQELERAMKEKDEKIKSAETNALEWQALAKTDASRAELETLDMEKNLKELERKNEELNVVVSTLLAKATKGEALEKDLETIRTKQTTAKSVGTNTRAIPVAQPIQLQFTPTTPKEMMNASTQVDIKPSHAPQVCTPLSAMRRKYQVQQNAMIAMQKDIENREKQQQQQQQEKVTPKEPSPTIGFELSAAYNNNNNNNNNNVFAREMATQTQSKEHVKAEEEEPSSSGFDDDQQHWVPTPNTRKHVEEKYVGGLQQQQSKQQSSSFSNAVDPTTSRLASLTPIRVPARQPIQERLPPQTMMSHAYSRSAEESRRFYDDDRMARLSRAMDISDSPFRRRY